MLLESPIRILIHRGCGLIDEDQPVAAIIVDQASGRIYGQRRPADDQHIRMFNCVQCLCQRVLIQAFFILEHYVRLHLPAACTGGNPCAVQHEFGVVHLVAALAEIAVDRPVQFQHVFTPGLLMQPSIFCVTTAVSFPAVSNSASFLWAALGCASR